MNHQIRIVCGIGFICVFLAALYGVSKMNYLLFHAVVESSSVVVGTAIFFFAWNVQRLEKNTYLIWIGPAFLSVAIIDFLHMLAYKGMGVFSWHDANLPTQLWVGARYVQSVSLCLLPFLHRRFTSHVLAFGVYMLVTVLLVATIFTGLFPDCYIEGVGLTPFKRGSEYLISLILLGAIWSTSRLVNIFDQGVLHLLMAAIGLTIASELAFTFYISVYDLSNMAGHLFKIVAFYLIYRAILQTGLLKPFDLLFHQLKQSEKKLQQEKEQLSQALANIKTLQGLLPICSKCKKIRDDTGYWNQVEQYIQKHSGVEFTHSVCPECLNKLYPEIDGLDET